MPIHIVPFADEHLESAALLVTQQVAQLVAHQVRSLERQVSSLPAQYSDPAGLLPIIQAISRAYPGVAALQDQRLVGFLTAWRLPNFQSAPAAFSPELANAAIPTHRQRIYEAMYAAIAKTWVEMGFRTHLISLLANDLPCLEALHNLGFGLFAGDGLRDLQPIPLPPSACSIRRASLADAETILSLDNALDSYLAGSPAFLQQASKHTLSEARDWIEDPHNALWIAWEGDQALGFIGLGPASQDACQVIVDQGTTSISAAYTIPAARSQGVGAVLLNHGLDWARSQGYTRCAVDFEMANPLGRRFWLRYFHPVSYSLCRRIF